MQPEESRTERDKSPEPVQWNGDVRLVLSDVDETIADLYLEAEPAMHRELESVLRDGTALFFVTGQSLRSVRWRVTDHLAPELRGRILIGSCSGGEVWGFNSAGDILPTPYYSLYGERLSEDQEREWRDIVGGLIDHFGLKTYPATPIADFKRQAGDNPLAVMMEDRGAQITLEFINGYDLDLADADRLEHYVPETHGSYDLRIPVLETAEQLLAEAQIPVTPRLAGVFALDFAVEGVSKTTAIRHVLEDARILQHLDLEKADLADPQSMEVWGDKFSAIRGGSDRYMSEALPRRVRSISFRDENPEEFLEGYNTIVWNGRGQLHEGLLEYLESRRGSDTSSDSDEAA